MSCGPPRPAAGAGRTGSRPGLCWLAVAMLPIGAFASGCAESGQLAGSDMAQIESGMPGATVRPPDAGVDRTPPSGELDRERTQARFPSTTELMRLIVAPTCAAEVNECHNSEDFPDMSTEGNLWNLVDLGCNKGLGERSEVEGFCESIGDSLRIEDGANSGFESRIGSILIVTDETETFANYELRVETPLPESQSDARFVIVRDGQPVRALGGGDSAQLVANGTVARITDEEAIPSVTAIEQGDENLDGVFGGGTGVVVHAGDPRGSYLLRRLLGQETNRQRMPSGVNADNPTERNVPLSREEIYVLMSWINCMEPGDGPYSPIRYDCAGNAANDGLW